ncbi:MAG: hypothetical protein CL840_19800 [Crocinitomicaceae bacterium]|nr:hypothetical protein [Crocinitomicaceae bacterium]|tara:strand:- start:5778 stop:6380 length:603 start_codon:yes stop_codon:yes gene_type:complete
MRLFNFFKNKGKSKPAKKVKKEKPSDHELAFAQVILNIIGPTVEKHDFVLHNKEIKKYSTTIIWRKKKQYVKVNSTTYPRDYPYHYNIIVGEGNSDDFLEYDWNSVAIWALARVTNPEIDVASYNFPYDEQQVKPSVEIAHKHLLTYGMTFLNGDLTIFNEARKMINKDREPYKIHSLGKYGKYETTDEPKSVEQKKKYS